MQISKRTNPRNVKLKIESAAVRAPVRTSALVVRRIGSCRMLWLVARHDG